MEVERYYTPFETRIGISPKDADLAIVSIDSSGSPGRLNLFVLKEYGYSNEDLPKADNLRNGFTARIDGKRKPIIFIVTIDGKPTNDNLQLNLYRALKENKTWLTDKKVWIPLMGTGDGGLTFEESYIITTETINRFLNENSINLSILIAVPDDQNGRIFIQNHNELVTPNTYEIKQFISSLNCNFYLVGSLWDGVDQTKKFFDEGFWEIGHEGNRYTELISQVKANDILIVKLNFTAKRTTNLRIKAFGIVVENPNKGAKIRVKWVIRDLKIDIEDLGYYRNTIAQINVSDIITIFSKLGKQKWDQLQIKNIPELNKGKERYETIIGLISDVEKGVDYLDITKDVTAFARVISAKSYEPPLAIALFGKWGSGKSFFMHKLKEAILNCSHNSYDGIYCKGIAHIQFNAWSYMDANLWASMVTKIFEGLNNYITENSLTDETKKEIEKELSNQLSFTKEEIGMLENKKASVNSQIEKFENQKESIKKELESAISKIGTNSLNKIIENIDEKFNAKQKIINAIKDNKSIISDEEELKKIIPEKYLNDPVTAYNQIKSKYTFLKEFFRRSNFKANLVWLVLILLVIFLTPFLLKIFVVKLNSISFTIPQTGLSLLVIVGSIWKRAEVIYKKLQPAISSFWEVKNNYEKEVKSAVAKFDQSEKALKLAFQRDNAELIRIEEQIQIAEALKSEIEFKINNSLASEALFHFIDKRAKSEDYRKHLGIISTIRKDFEILSDLFIDHNNEVSLVKEEFKNKFKKPLERIILYIDDLDRCPEENVVQVLEAVNLLMAFPLFIVIVGVDSRWVKNALIKKHALQFTGKVNGFEMPETDLELIEPSNYLEKIFQIPFHLKDAKDADVKEMIKNLAQVKPDLKEITATNAKTQEQNSNDSESFLINNTNQNDSFKVSPKSASVEEIKDRPQALILTNEEVLLMQDMSEIIGNNPRAVKRFVNIFRIIKAHEEFDYEERSIKQNLPAILFLIALPLGKYKTLLSSFELYIQNEKNKNSPITLYMQPANRLSKNGDLNLDNLKHELNVLLTNKLSFDQLQNTACEVIIKHNKLIKRFTFKNI